MATNLELQRVNEWSAMRGFANLFHKENRAWWGTRRWWVNALVWAVILCGLTANMLFVPTIASLADEGEIARAGGLTPYVLQMGLSVFFEFGLSALAIGAVVLSQDLILGEKQNGTAEWLLSKPVTRRAYILAKAAANGLALLVLLVSLPSLLAYGMFSVRLGAPYPWQPFLSAVGIMALHTVFYLTLTLALGTIFNNRSIVLALGLGSALGGNLLGGFLKPLLPVTPWMLNKTASLTASARAIPFEVGTAPLIATTLWCVVLVIVALVKFERTEF